MKTTDKSPLVSVVIATKNESENIAQCITSIIQQSYKNIEILVVDNHSNDATLEIAKKYTSNIYTIGPERSTQRNYGINKAKGTYVLFLDADMLLAKDVILDCVTLSTSNTKIAGVIIPEESFGIGFWAECKKLERSFYIGEDWIEAARFFRKKIISDLGGYDESMISGEDWDLSQRVRTIGKIDRVSSKILHNEGKLTLTETISKKYYYAKKIKLYFDKHNKDTSKQNQINLIKRYGIFLTNPKKLFSKPLVGIGMLFMKTCEFTAGGIALLFSKV